MRILLTGCAGFAVVGHDVVGHIGVIGDVCVAAERPPLATEAFPE